MNERFEIDLRPDKGDLVLWDHGGNRQRFVVPLTELVNLIDSLNAVHEHLHGHQHEEN